MNPNEQGMQNLFDEAAFQDWYAKVSKRLQLNPNPDDPSHHYDYRTMYSDMLSEGTDTSPKKAGGHFYSKYKTEGHPRTYLADPQGKVFNTKTAQYITGQPVSNHNLKASEGAADMPGFNEQSAANLLQIAPGISSLMRFGR